MHVLAGKDGAGVVEEVAPDVTHLRVGQRVQLGEAWNPELHRCHVFLVVSVGETTGETRGNQGDTRGTPGETRGNQGKPGGIHTVDGCG